MLAGAIDGGLRLGMVREWQLPYSWGIWIVPLSIDHQWIAYFSLPLLGYDHDASIHETISL